MTSPDGYQPPPPARIEDIKPTVQGLADVMLSNVGTIAKNIFDAIGKAIAGKFIGQAGPLGQISDGQQALTGHVEILDGTRGYCAAYQAENINIAWNNANNVRDLPFTGELGVSKGAHIDKAKAGIVFEEQGLWLVFATARGRKTGFTGDDTISLFVDVMRPDGTIYSPMIFESRPGTDNASVGGAIAVEIPAPGYYVRVRCWSGRWRWWDGGSKFTRLIVVKQDARLTNAGESTVPDEPEPPSSETPQ